MGSLFIFLSQEGVKTQKRYLKNKNRLIWFLSSHNNEIKYRVLITSSFLYLTPFLTSKCTCYLSLWDIKILKDDIKTLIRIVNSRIDSKNNSHCFNGIVHI